MGSRSTFLADESGLSTVVGITLLVALTIGLVILAGGMLVEFGQQQQTQAPTAAITVDPDPDPDGTFSDSGNGGICAGDTYEDDDKLTVNFRSGDILDERNITIMVGSTEASMAPCAGGDTRLDYLTTVPDEIAAGNSITVAEGLNNNAIRSGATVRVIWNNPNNDERFTIHRSTI